MEASAMVRPRDAPKLLEEALQVTRAVAPDGEVRITLTEARQANTRYARSEVTSNGDVDETTVNLEVAFGLRHAGYVTNQVDAASLRQAAEMAARLARLAPEDPEWMPVLPPQKYIPVPKAHDERVAAMTAQDRAEAIKPCLAAAAKGKVEVAGMIQHSSDLTLVGTSAGLRASHTETGIDFSTTARTPDGTGSGWAAAGSHQRADVNAAALSAVAIDKAVRAAKPKRLEPGHYTVILDAAAVADLLEFLVWSLDARRADEGRSFFSRKGGGNRLGEALFGSHVTLQSDPTSSATPGAPFDEQGLPLTPTTWLDKGVLAALSYTRYWAQKQGRAPTGSHRAFELQGGSVAAVDLLKGVKRGVLVTRFWYTRWVDPQSLLVTGLTRDGVFLVENGSVVAPVNNFRFNESPLTMLKNADAMTLQTWRPHSWSVRCPSLRTHGFNLASISDAV
jgi:predicted Zn-dependent protease